MNNKNTKFKILKILILIVIMATTTILCVMLLNPLRLPEGSIRMIILNKTPLGTQFSEVRKCIEKEGWKIDTVDENNGFWDQRENKNAVVGEKSIRASLGDYQDIPFMANVTVFWGFDKNSRLIDIWVWKTWDGL